MKCGGLTTEGFFQTEEEIKNHADQSAVGEDDQSYKFYVGDLKFADLNNDGKINKGDWTLANRVISAKLVIVRADILIVLIFRQTGKGFDIRGFFQGIGKKRLVCRRWKSLFLGNLRTALDKCTNS